MQMTHCRCHFLPAGKTGAGSPIFERFVGAVREPPVSTLSRIEFPLRLRFKLCVSSLDEAPVTSGGPAQAQCIDPRRRSGRLHDHSPSPAAGAQEHHGDEGKPKPISNLTFPRPGQHHATSNFLDGDSGGVRGCTSMGLGRQNGQAHVVQVFHNEQDLDRAPSFTGQARYASPGAQVRGSRHPACGRSERHPA